MASYSVTRHDSEFFVQRDIEGVSDYVGPFHHSEFQAVLEACRDGTFDWERHDPFDEIGPPRRWPQLRREHQVDVQPGETGFFVVVDKPPMFVKAGGGLVFSGQYKAFYPSREQATLAATHILATVATRGQLDEHEIDDRVNAGRLEIADGATNATETSVFEVRSRRPPGRGPLFAPITDAARRHRVAFYGDDVAVTPPLPSRLAARDLADKLDRLHRRGAVVPFQAYRFSKLRPDDRRVFVDQIDRRPYVLVDGSDKLGRLGPFETERDAAAIRRVLAREIRRVESIRWDAYDKAYGFTWSEHPDRLRLSTVPEGFRIECHTEDRIGISDSVYRSKPEAIRALDTQRRALYRTGTLDPARWSFYRLDGEPIAQELASAPPWRPVETSLDRLVDELRADAHHDTLRDLLQEATEDIGYRMRSALEPLTDSEEQRLLDGVATYARIHETRREAQQIRTRLADPRFDTPFCTEADHREAKTHQLRLTKLESDLAELPRETRLATEIARGLQGKRFDPGALIRHLDAPLDHHAFELLSSFRSVQQDYLPAMVTLAEATRESGREVPIQLVDRDHIRWFDTIRDLAPPDVADSIATVGRGIEKARRMASERTSDLAL